MGTQTYTETRTRTESAVYKKPAYGFIISWVLMTLCFMIINIIVFAEPQWIGDTLHSPGAGYVGLYQLCEFVDYGATRICDGMFQNFDTILTDSFRASTFFIGVSVLVIFLCVLLFLLFICVRRYYVLITCGVLQVISCILMFLGCVLFPGGWDHMYVRRICGDDVNSYAIGQCEMRWAYILAIIGIFIILMLAIMAFCLACRDPYKWKNDRVMKSLRKTGVDYVDARDGTTLSSKSKTKSKLKKGYVVDIRSQVDYDGRSMPPSYYGGTPSQLGARSGMYGSQPILYNGAGHSELMVPRYHPHGVASTSGRLGYEGSHYRNGGASSSGHAGYHTEPRPRRGSM